MSASPVSKAAEPLAQPSAQHTSTPYCVESPRLDSVITIQTANGRSICDIVGTMPVDEANAAFILRACNSHDALLAALREILECGPSAWNRDTEDRARAAIAMATVQP